MLETRRRWAEEAKEAANAAGVAAARLQGVATALGRTEDAAEGVKAALDERVAASSDTQALRAVQIALRQLRRESADLGVQIGVAQARLTRMRKGVSQD
jgi:hypothetical protein